MTHCAWKVNESELGVRSSRRECLPFTGSSSWAPALAMSRLMQSRCQMALAADPGFPLRKTFPGGKVQVHGGVTFPDSLFFCLFSSRWSVTITGPRTRTRSTTGTSSCRCSQSRCCPSGPSGSLGSAVCVGLSDFIEWPRLERWRSPGNRIFAGSSPVVAACRLGTAVQLEALSYYPYHSSSSPLCSYRRNSSTHTGSSATSTIRCGRTTESQRPPSPWSSLWGLSGTTSTGRPGPGPPWCTAGTQPRGANEMTPGRLEKSGGWGSGGRRRSLGSDVASSLLLLSNLIPFHRLLSPFLLSSHTSSLSPSSLSPSLHPSLSLKSKIVWHMALGPAISNYK